MATVQELINKLNLLDPSLKVYYPKNGYYQEIECIFPSYMNEDATQHWDTEEEYIQDGNDLPFEIDAVVLR